MLEDGTPVKMRIGRTVSSADAHVGDTVDFEVLEEVHVGNMLVIPKGGTAWATVTEAKSKGHMGKGGKLDINIDSVRLVDGEKAALRAVKEMKGGGHTGAMTGAIVATSLVFFPAAPFFLFMHGKDISIPKGTEITAYVNGNFPIDVAKFQPVLAPTPAMAVSASMAPAAAAVASSATDVEISSAPAGADILVDNNFVGNTPSSISVGAGDHTISISLAGYQPWNRNIHTSGGKINLTASLVKAAASNRNATPAQDATEYAQPVSLGDAARATRAQHAAHNSAPQN
jgi:hypothetical protein